MNSHIKLQVESYYDTIKTKLNNMGYNYSRFIISHDDVWYVGIPISAHIPRSDRVSIHETFKDVEHNIRRFTKKRVLFYLKETYR